MFCKPGYTNLDLIKGNAFVRTRKSEKYYNHFSQYCWYCYSENMHFYVYKLSKTIEIISTRFKSQLEQALIEHKGYNFGTDNQYFNS